MEKGKNRISRGNPAERSREKETAGFFAGSMKLAALIEANYKLLPVLERLGISLGFGDVSVEEACRGRGIPVDFFLLLCHIHTFEDYHPDDSQLGGVNIKDVVEYLHNSHEYYARRQVPRLKEKLYRMVEVYSQDNKKILALFFDNYQSELTSHFDYEEKTVFPYVKRLADSRAGGGYSIEQFEENHSNIEEKLNDLKNIVLKYLPPAANTDLRNEVLYDIFLLEDDLNKHTLIENRVLIPLVAKIENDEGA